MGLFDDLPEPNGSSSNTAPPEAQSIPATKRKSLDSDVIKKKTKVELRTIKCYCVARQGEREQMQDAHTILDDFITKLATSVDRMSFYGVYDGHGGLRASQFCAENLHVKIEENIPEGDASRIDKEMKACFVDAFAKTDKAFLEKARKEKPFWKDGTTVVVSVVIDNMLFVANVGDSKAVLYRMNKSTNLLTPIVLSKDHTPTAYDERLRIQKAGGTVREGRLMGVLEVSRSIGDGQFKTCGLSCLPDIKKCQLSSDDRFMILACDGLWKSFTVQEIGEELKKIVEHQTDLTEDEIAQKCESVMIHLANESIRRGCEDNVTILLLHIS